MENIIVCHPLATKPDNFEMIESFGVVIPPNMMSLYLSTEYLPMKGDIRDTHVDNLLQLWADTANNSMPILGGFLAHSHESGHFWISWLANLLFMVTDYSPLSFNVVYPPNCRSKEYDFEEKENNGTEELQRS